MKKSIYENCNIREHSKWLRNLLLNFPVKSMIAFLATWDALFLVNGFDLAYPIPRWILEDLLKTLHISLLFYLGLNLWIYFAEIGIIIRNRYCLYSG